MSRHVPSAGPHGGDGPAVARALGMEPGEILDLSLSLNPFAPDIRPLLRSAIEDGTTARYPDEKEAEALLAAAIGVDEERVVLTNGGSDAISLVARALGRGRVVEPEFSLYARAIPVLDDNGPLFRSNPHSPSGRLAPADQSADVWDEAFYPLATGSWTRGDEGAFVVGSLTKLFACPGLRVGYVICPDSQSGELLRHLRPVWPLNSLAVACIPQMLALIDLGETARSITEARSDLFGLLESYGLTVDGGDANWVLVSRCPELRDRLAPHGVVVRDCSSFGLTETVRIAVTTPEGLRRLEHALGRVFGSHEATRRPKAAGGLLVCGTGSDVGKSAFVTGLCRVLKRRGVSVAPFKAQNMALNSWVTDDGAEIGRAQGVQAFASRIPAEAAMNPILLKPTGDRHSQVVVMGEPKATLDVQGYHQMKKELVGIVHDALSDLRGRFDTVICEGAGSPAEINLLDHDIVNLRFAHREGIPAIVVGDIDRGGVFASLFGTVALLPSELRDLVQGFVINKFRGDASLLEPGLRDLEQRTGVPTLGVVPWIDGVALDAEDSLALSRIGSAAAGISETVLDVAVIRFPRISNFTDIDALSIEPGVRLRMVDHKGLLGDPDLVVLPGTKTTVSDLDWLRSNGLADAIERIRKKTTVLAICGGYQMVGETIEDSDGVESREQRVSGLGWLPVETRFARRKTVARRSGAMTLGGVWPVEGYEIRHGVTVSNRKSTTSEWVRLNDGHGEDVAGFCDVEAGVLATSMHGLLENDSARRALLELAAGRRGKTYSGPEVSFCEAREAQIDKLADTIEKNVEIDRLLEIIERSRSEVAVH